jgi:predicted MPP superfamily phosphohydrolase
MSSFAVGSALGLGAVTSAAAVLRSRFFATFVFVMLGVHTLIAVALYSRFAALGPWAAGAFVYLQGAVFLHFLALTRPRLRPLPYRLLVSLPGSWFAAGTYFAMPWAAAAAFGLELPAVWLPYALALFGLYQSLSLRRETVDIVVDRAYAGDLSRHEPGPWRAERPLTVVQITDPHLGPFMSEARLRAICQRAVDQDPDLVLLTGDFFTMEAQGTPGCLGRALAPLKALEGRAYACRGNHDHEAPRMVAEGLAEAGVVLLNDAAAVVETPAGPVQIVGIDHRWRGRAEAFREIAARYPRVPGALRLVLLHDPSAFDQLDPGQGDLVLSGHTHGGQVGAVSFGGRWTFVSALFRIPDHGLWSRGPDRMYIHKGTGHYGFPLRLGVPGEESLLRIHVKRDALTAD